MESTEQLDIQPDPPPLRKKFRRARRSQFCTVALFLGGVVLPVTALIVELTLRFCSMVFFDPIPSLAHIALVASVPLANFLVLAKWLRPRFLTTGILSAMVGFAMAIAGIYSLLYLPILPFSVFYTAMSFAALFLPACITILPFSPLASLVTSLFCLQRLRRQAFESGSRRVSPFAALGITAAVFSVVLLEAPRVITRTQMQALQSSTDDASALSLLRRFGDEQSMLEAAYGSARPNDDFAGWIMRIVRAPIFSFETIGSNRMAIDSDSARRIFYQVTGDNFNSRVRPQAQAGLFGWFDRASDVGKHAVGGRADEVALITSTLDSSIDPLSLTSYTEWTMVFRNSGSIQNEARAELRLPAGGVVSRATLWVNGEEREAAFGGRAETMNAYQRVAVVQRRDPLLITSSGPDQVLVQCFPVPPAGEMKIRVGITAPLVVANANQGRFSLPHFVEHNFRIEKQSGRSLWLESKTPIQADAGDLSPSQSDNALFALRGDAAFETAPIQVTAALDSLPAEIISVDNTNNQSTTFRQRVEYAQLAAHRNVIIVVDGSKSIDHYAADLIAAIQHIQPGTGVAVFIAGDSVVPVTNGVQELTPELAKKLAADLRNFVFIGGRDNSTAVITALDLQLATRDSTVVWFHGPQPIPASIEQFAQRKTRRPNAPKIIQVELAEGTNELVTGLNEIGLLDSLPSALAVNEPIAKQLTALVSGAGYYRIHRDTLGGSIFGPPNSSPMSYGHLNRLAANDQVAALLETNTSASRTAAKELAIRYRIVTPASGAVVLENDAQYRENGLQPANADTVPVIPEPETYLLVVAALGLLALSRRFVRCSER